MQGLQKPVGSAPTGSFTTTCLRSVHFGPDSIEKLPSILKDITRDSTNDTLPKVLIITGKSLAASPVIPHIEELLRKHNAFAGTFTKMRQHSPIEDIEAALGVMSEEGASVLLAVGGGSSIDACKTISYFNRERNGAFIQHIAVPTTLSAAEFTQIAGHTSKEGKKTVVSAEEICPKAIILDPKIALHTPQKLWLSTGIRALDHACETLYRPGGQYPLQQLALSAIRDLFTYLPQCVDKEGQDVEARGRLQVAAWMSLFPSRLETALGPSHALGHGLGATYSIPHGVCSVLTLPNTVRAMARTLPAASPERAMLANAFSYLPTSYVRDHMSLQSGEGDEEENACLVVAAALDTLIDRLGLQTALSEYKVPKEDLEKLAKEAYATTSGKPGWKEICPSPEQLLKRVLEPIF